MSDQAPEPHNPNPQGPPPGHQPSPQPGEGTPPAGYGPGVTPGPGYGPGAYGPAGGQPGYPPAGYGHPGHGPAGYASAAPSTFGGLTDLGFGRRITPALAKIVYLAVVALAVLMTIVGVVSAIGMFTSAGDPFIGGAGLVFTGLFMLIATPLSSFVMVAFARFWLEIFLDRAAEAQRAGR